MLHDKTLPGRAKIMTDCANLVAAFPNANMLAFGKMQIFVELAGLRVRTH